MASRYLGLLLALLFANQTSAECLSYIEDNYTFALWSQRGSAEVIKENNQFSRNESIFRAISERLGSDSNFDYKIFPLRRLYHEVSQTSDFITAAFVVDDVFPTERYKSIGIHVFENSFYDSYLASYTVKNRFPQGNMPPASELRIGVLRIPPSFRKGFANSYGNYKSVHRFGDIKAMAKALYTGRVDVVVATRDLFVNAGRSLSINTAFEEVGVSRVISYHFAVSNLHSMDTIQKLETCLAGPAFNRPQEDASASDPSGQ